MGQDQGTGEAAGGKQNRQHSVPSTHPTETFWAQERIPGTALLGSGRGFRPWPVMSAPSLSSHARLGTRQILPGLLRPHGRGVQGGQQGSHMDAETARWEAGWPAVAEGEVAGSKSVQCRELTRGPFSLLKLHGPDRI